MTALTTTPRRPLTVIDGVLRYLDESHWPEAERSTVTVADAINAEPFPVCYPPEAVAPPTWMPWEFEVNSHRHTSTSPLVWYRTWAAAARDHLRLRSDDYAEGFALAWKCFGSRKENDR